METKSTVQAMFAVLNAMFEAMPLEMRRRAVVLIEDSQDIVDDPDAKALMRTFDLVPLPVKKPPLPKKKKARRRA
jgi:hypothetical protein